MTNIKTKNMNKTYNFLNALNENKIIWLLSVMDNALIENNAFAVASAKEFCKANNIFYKYLVQWYVEAY